MLTHPGARLLRIERGGDGVILATVFAHHPDGDEFDGAAVVNELGVVEIAHASRLVMRRRRRRELIGRWRFILARNIVHTRRIAP
ncbi:Uncharacterised protein [Mycobacteroides abscessus subsp. abscessus]|nr:Uncharacterised protein [Mycobacteroides abscessus subsp. abscessus]